MSEQEPGAAAGPARLAAPLLVALFAVALAAALIVYQARTPDLALEVPELEETFARSDEDPSAELVFFTRFDEHAARISIVGSGQREVAVLAEDFPLLAGQRVACSWDGTTSRGDLARRGSYRLRVEAPTEGRDMVFPDKIRLIPAQDRDGSLERAVFARCEALG